MTKIISSKYKLDRRVGKNIWGSPKSPVNRRDYPPGQHGSNRRGRLSDYGLQLQAKQILRRFYGNIMERQFRNIYKEADRRRGDTSQTLIGLLESRLDAVVYRACFASTVFAARQLVSHGCIRVNGKRVKIPSAKVKPGDVISVGEKWHNSQPVQLGAESLKIRKVPDYIEVHKKRPEAKFIHLPKIEEVPYGVQMEPNLVIEFYSR